jgi:hypothetical protein
VDDDDGIAWGCAYAIIDAVACSNGERLVRVRDPWAGAYTRPIFSST